MGHVQPEIDRNLSPERRKSVLPACPIILTIDSGFVRTYFAATARTWL